MHHAITFGRVLVDRRIVTPVLALALVLATLLAAAAPALAQGGGGPLTATGVLERAAPHSPDPTPVYAITDEEEAGTSYELVSGFVDLEQYVGERVTIQGVPVPGPGDLSKPPLLNVTQIEPAGGPGDGGDDDPPVSCQSLDCPRPGDPDDTATLTFELTVQGEPPAEATFLGHTPAESLLPVRLTDPDGDGVYTGSRTLPKYAPGPRPVPPHVEPVSVPAQIVQGPPTGYSGLGPEYRVIKDFGEVKLDGDKTLAASVSFADDGGSDDDNDGSDGSDSDNSGGGSGSGGTGGDEASGGREFSGIKDLLPRSLPATGGVPLTLGAVGALLAAGGLLVRKAFR